MFRFVINGYYRFIPVSVDPLVGPLAQGNNNREQAVAFLRQLVGCARTPRISRHFVEDASGI